jgi:hypothetical protein
LVRSEQAEYYQRTTMPVVTGPRGGQICTTYIQQSTVEVDKKKGNYWLNRIF